MIKNKLPVRFTGQHFTIDKVLIADAIKIAKINETDTVLDIGAGKGFITVSDYPFMHLLYSQLLVCQRVCLQNTVCLICK